MAVDPLLLGNIIQGGAQLIGGMFNGYSQRSAVKEANKGNMELAKYQNARNIELWNANNEYNTPGAQMGRLQEAGLNPNLVYGSGSVVGNTSSPPPSTNVPTLQPAPFQIDSTAWSGLSQIADNALKAANIKRTLKEAELMDYQRVGIEKDNELKDLDIIFKGYANAKSKEEALIWKEMLNAKVSLLEGQQILNAASAQNIDSTRIFRDTYGKNESLQRVSNMQQQNKESNARIDLMSHQSDSYDSNVAKNASDIALNAYKAKNLEALSEESRKRATYYGGLNNEVSERVKAIQHDLVLKDDTHALNILNMALTSLEFMGYRNGNAGRILLQRLGVSKFPKEYLDQIENVIMNRSKK